MDLKAFKGLPHEFGGIDYTEGSEVEGGEFAVNIGKSGNEYIFDKNSSEGEKLSKEYKRLDMNGRLSEDDPLSLETFDQIAREEALKHAQRSVNEKGIDPFRNMYDQGGQAANGGVKYAAGGAKDMYFGGGVMALMPGGMIDAGTGDEGLMKKKIGEVTNLGNGGVNKYATGGYNPRAMGNPIVGPNMMRLADTMGGVDGILAMSNPNYSNPNNPNNPNYFGEDVGEVYPEGHFKGVSGSSLNASAPVSDVNNLTGTGKNDAIDLRPQDNLSYNTLRESEAMPTMETIPTMESYELPTEPTPEMPTADASYDVSSADIGASGSTGGGGGMSAVTKPLSMAGDLIQALDPQTKGGSDWQIAEKGNTRQKSIAPKYAWSTSGEMIGAGMEGMSQGAAAGPLGAAAGMMLGVVGKGMADQKANKQLQLAFKSALMQKNAEERRDEQWDAISRDVDSTELIDKDRYQGLNQLGGTTNKFAKQGGALPKNKGVYGYYANGGGVGNPTTGAELVEQMRYKRGVNTLDSGITYQDLQDARSYPVYDEAGNEMAGVRNIGASSMSPGFNVRTNTPQSRVAASPQLNNTMRMQEMPARPLARQSAPQYYAPTAQDFFGNYGLNQNVKQGFNLYNEPLKYAQKGNYYNPDVRPTSTLINNETGESYDFKNGGGKKKEEGVNKDYANKIRKAEQDFNESLGRPIDKAFDTFRDELYNNPRLAGDDMYLDPYRHGMAGYYTADAMRKKMPDWMPESVANKLAIAGSTIAGVGHEFTSPATERMGLVDGLTEAGEDAYNNYVGAKMIEDVLFDREAKQLMLDNIRKEKTYAGVVQSDSEPYTEFDPKRFKNGGGKDKEELLTGPTGPTGATGIAVSPTGAAYSSDQMSLDNRGVGSSDYGVIPANLEQYARTLFGSNKQFTEKDMTPEEYKALVDLYNIREKSHTIGYPDHDKVGSTNTSKAGMVSKLTNEPDIIRNLIGKAAVKDGYITSDYNFVNKPLSKILKNLNAEDLMAWAHNNSPFVDSEAMAKKDAIKIKMPNRKNSQYPIAGL